MIMNTENKKAKIRTEIKNLNKEDTIEHYNAVLIEQILSEVQAVAEKVENSDAKSEERYQLLRKEMNERFEVVEAAIGYHSGEIKGLRTDMQGLKTGVQDLKTDMQGLKTDMQGLKTELHQVEVRLSNKIDGHESRITTLEKAS